MGARNRDKAVKVHEPLPNAKQQQEVESWSIRDLFSGGWNTERVSYSNGVWLREKWQPFCQKPLVIRTKWPPFCLDFQWSGFQMVQTKATAIAMANHSKTKLLEI